MDIPAIPITWIEDRHPERRRSKRKRRDDKHQKEGDNSLHNPDSSDSDGDHLDIVA
ncbi:MAG: hypothetical protein ACYTFY_09135 [Planctomycetota bacterium]